MSAQWREPEAAILTILVRMALGVQHRPEEKP